MEDVAAVDGAEHAEISECVENPVEVPLVPDEEDRGAERTPEEDVDDDDEEEDEVDKLVDHERMEENDVEKNDTGKVYGLEEPDDDVERVAGDRGIR